VLVDFAERPFSGAFTARVDGAIILPMTIDARQSQGRVVLVVHGSFDRQDTRDVEAAVEGLGPGARVTIDLRDVRVCDDAAVAKLARDLTDDLALNVELLGLSDHHRRLLRYLGIRAPRH
jgi:anti-anti-sigma regulatory factor